MPEYYDDEKDGVDPYWEDEDDFDDDDFDAALEEDGYDL